MVCGCICGTTIDSAWPNHLATVLAAHFDFNGGVYQLERRIQPRKIQIFPVSLLCRVRCFAFSKGLLYMIVENSTTFLIFCHAPVPIPTIPRSSVSHAPFMLDIPSFQLVSLPAIPIFYPPSHRLCSSVASVSARSSHLYACAFRYISSSHFPRFAVITIFTHKSKMCKNVYIILYVYIYIYIPALSAHLHPGLQLATKPRSSQKPRFGITSTTPYDRRPREKSREKRSERSVAAGLMEILSYYPLVN